MRGLGHIVSSSVGLLGLALLSACAGGQTGEITMLGHCEEARPLSGLDALDPATRLKLDAVLAPFHGTLTWDMEGGDAPPSTTPFEIATTLRDGPVEELGESGCLRVRVPIAVRLVTEDGQLDATLDAAVEIGREGPAMIRGDAALDRVDGALDLSWLGPMPEGALHAELDREGGRSAGQLFVDPGPASDEVRVASW